MVRKPGKKRVVRAKRPETQSAPRQTFLSSLASVKVGSTRSSKTHGKKQVISLTRAKNTADGKVLIKDNTPKKQAPKEKEQGKTTAIVVRTRLQLALLSPFRFPMPSERLMVGVARYSGVFFVLVGAIFSLAHLQYASGVYTNDMFTQRANMYDSTSTSSGTLLTTPTENTDTTPDARITVEGGGDILSSTVAINVIVPLAIEVKLVLDDRTRNTYIPLGNMVKMEETTWRFYWNTNQFLDGTYRIKAIIKNQYGTYEHTGSESYEIRNTPLETNTGEPTGSDTINSTTSIQSTTTDTSTSSSTTTQSTENATSTVTLSNTLPTVDLRIGESSPVDGGVSLKVFVHDATEVKVYARNTHTAVLYFIGMGVFQSGEEWRLTWQSEKVPDGNYMLQAKAMVNGTLYESGSRSVAVDNIDEEEATASTTTQATSTGITVQPYQPTIRLTLSKESPLSGYVDIFANTSPVMGVELFAQPKTALMPLFIGAAQKLNDETSWKFNWNTKQSPNGEYYLFARVKSQYGTVDGSKIQVKVLNEVIATFTETQESEINTMNTANDALIKTTEEAEISDDAPPPPEPFVQPKVVYIQPVESFIESVDTEDDTRDEIERLLRDFRERLSDKLDELARAIRSGDEEALTRVRADIEDIKNDVLLSLPGSIEKKEIIDTINSYLSQVAFELEELTIKNETILKERIGDAVLKDSDKDGVSDYDEVNLYQTNPFAADTDGDGYIDSSEITLGYNPHDPKSEALVTYESPKETGIVREDILVVDSIMTLTPDEEISDTEPKALISGKGLPNSFVTLYIYSTPIIITVKTDAEGSWSYVFDKELEDGEHEVYIGITDNAGRVVAKSNPLPFVKTAEAFTGSAATDTESGTSVQAPSLLEGRVMLLVASIAIVALGLVLILLGIHVSNRRLETPNIVTV